MRVSFVFSALCLIMCLDAASGQFNRIREEITRIRASELVEETPQAEQPRTLTATIASVSVLAVSSSGVDETTPSPDGGSHELDFGNGVNLSLLIAVVLIPCLLIFFLICGFFTSLHKRCSERHEENVARLAKEQRNQDQQRKREQYQQRVEEQQRMDEQLHVNRTQPRVHFGAATAPSKPLSPQLQSQSQPQPQAQPQPQPQPQPQQSQPQLQPKPLSPSQSPAPSTPHSKSQSPNASQPETPRQSGSVPLLQSLRRDSESQGPHLSVILLQRLSQQLSEPPIPGNDNDNDNNPGAPGSSIKLAEPAKVQPPPSPSSKKISQSIFVEEDEEDVQGGPVHIAPRNSLLSRQPSKSGRSGRSSRKGSESSNGGGGSILGMLGSRHAESRSAKPPRKVSTETEKRRRESDAIDLELAEFEAEFKEMSGPSAKLEVGALYALRRGRQPGT